MAKSSWIPALVLLLLAFGMDALVFQKAFYQPNDSLFTFGGDGLIIHHNMNYHTRYGDGVRLRSMNYPRGELIFMTDAQAGVSLALSWLHKQGVPVADRVICISNGLLWYLLPLASLWLWLILLRFRVNPWFALPFAVVLPFLSPQLARICSGHYGLGYVFFIPMMIWWTLLAWEKSSRPWGLYFLLILPVSLWIGFNNPYLLAIGQSFPAAFGLVVLAAAGWRRSGPFFGAAALPLLIVYVLLKWLAPFAGRLEIPFGFFFNRTTLAGLFVPEHGPLTDWLGVSLPDVEGRAYLGLVPALIVLLLVFRWLVRWGRERVIPEIGLSDSARYTGWAALIILLFAFRLPVYDLLMPFADTLSFLMQFRAPGRFAWVVYFCFSTLAVAGLWQVFDRARTGRFKGMAWAGLLAILLLWAWDAFSFSRAKVGNVYSSSFKEMDAEYSGVLEAVRPEAYQAMLQLPLDQGWAKFHFESWWPTQYHGYMVSTVTGLPMLNARLSRIPVDHTLAAVEMISDPVVERTILDVLPKPDPLLIIVGKDAPLSAHEQLLLHLSDTVYTDDRFLLASFPTDTPYFRDYRDSLRRQYHRASDREVLSSSKSALVNLHFDEEEAGAPATFFGEGAYALRPGRSILWEGPVSAPFRSQPLAVSVWVYGYEHSTGSIGLDLIQLAADGREIRRDHTNAINARNVQGKWIRAEIQTTLDSACTQLRVEAEYAYTIWLDELLIHRQGDTVYHRLPHRSDQVLVNNFKLDLQASR